jgi:hypothetical protein
LKKNYKAEGKIIVAAQRTFKQKFNGVKRFRYLKEMKEIKRVRLKMQS